MPRFLLTLLLTLSLIGLHALAPAPAWAVYRVDYGDHIIVTVKDMPQYSITAELRPDGAITVPFLGDVEIKGLTTTEAQQRIATMLKAYVVNPQVAVTIAQFRPRMVTLLGQVHNPGLKDLTPAEQSVFDIIAQGGGFTDRAVKSQVTLIRGTGPNTKRYVIDFDEILKTGDFSANMMVQDGDKIQVPEVWWPDVNTLFQTLTSVVGVVGVVMYFINLYQQASGKSGTSSTGH